MVNHPNRAKRGKYLVFAWQAAAPEMEPQQAAFIIEGPAMRGITTVQEAQIARFLTKVLNAADELSETET